MSKIPLKKYQEKIAHLNGLSKTNHPTAIRHLEQLAQTIQDFYSSTKNDSNQNLLDYHPIQIKFAEIEMYLSSFSKNELKNPRPAITSSHPPEYPDLTEEDLQGI